MQPAVTKSESHLRRPKHNCLPLESRPMRRWLFVLFLLVLPFQMVWAAAAPYCAHEAQTSTKKHFGHHEHQHAAGGEMAPALGDNPGDAGGHHTDCKSCHLGCSGALSIVELVIGSLPRGGNLGVAAQRYTSHVPAGPERPDRCELNAAARFGGGVASDLLAA